MMQLTDRAFHSMDAAIAANPAGNGSDIFKRPIVPYQTLPVNDDAAFDSTFEVATYQVRYSGDDCLYRWVRVS